MIYKVAVALVGFLAIGCGKQESPGTGAGGKAGNKVVQVRVVWTQGCVNTAPTIELVRRTAAEVGANISLDNVVIATQDEAVRYRFHGSPTVLLNGQDLDPKRRNDTKYGFS